MKQAFKQYMIANVLFIIAYVMFFMVKIDVYMIFLYIYLLSINIYYFKKYDNEKYLHFVAERYERQCAITDELVKIYGSRLKQKDEEIERLKGEMKND